MLMMIMIAMPVYDAGSNGNNMVLIAASAGRNIGGDDEDKDGV